MSVVQNTGFRLNVTFAMHTFLKYFHLSLCVCSVCARTCMCFICYGAHVKVRGQLQVSTLTFCLVWDTVSSNSPLQVPGELAQGPPEILLSLPSTHHQPTEIAYVHFCIRLWVLGSQTEVLILFMTSALTHRAIVSVLHKHFQAPTASKVQHLSINKLFMWIS
jgi:hypothetical protein